MSLKPIVIGAATGALVIGLAMAPGARAIQAALVNVVNTAASPVPVRPSIQLDRYATRINPNPRTPAIITVPADKYLVIDSVTGFNNGGVSGDIAVDAVQSGQISEQRIPFHRPMSTGMWYLESAKTEIVADPGSRVVVYVTGPSTDNAGFNIDVRGYYLPAN